MKCSEGLNASLKEISLYVVDDDGGVVFRKNLPFCSLSASLASRAIRFDLTVLTALSAVDIAAP
ncbi:MAG: hypothetical protein AAF360_12910 [Pseudomonadota bacterium]